MRPQAIPYVTARAAQNAFVRSAGHDLAKHGVRFNAVAQNFVANETYYPPELLANPKFVARVEREVPAGRVADIWSRSNKRSLRRNRTLRRRQKCAP